LDGVFLTNERYEIADEFLFVWAVMEFSKVFRIATLARTNPWITTIDNLEVIPGQFVVVMVFARKLVPAKRNTGNP